jgi:hypothetical protein
MAKKIEQTIQLWNLLHEGNRKPITVVAKADNGSTYTVLPRSLADELALMPRGAVSVRRARRPRVTGLCIRVPGIPGRLIVTDALVEPKRTTVLLGCEEMERMDLIADHRAGVLRPRPGTEKGITAVVE